MNIKETVTLLFEADAFRDITHRLLHNPATPTDVLTSVYHRWDGIHHGVDDWLAQHKNTHPDILHSLAKRGVENNDDTTLYHVAKNPNTASPTLHLMTHPVVHGHLLYGTRLANLILKHPNVTKAIKHVLVYDPNREPVPEIKYS